MLHLSDLSVYFTAGYFFITVARGNSLLANLLNAAMPQFLHMEVKKSS